MNIQKTLTAKCFSKAALQYQANARVQARAAERLFALMDGEHKNIALDLGCGPGQHFDALSTFAERVVQLDLSESMLNSACNSAHKVCADMDALPFQTHSFDLVFSNFAVQWSQNLAELLEQLYIITKPNGSLYLSVVCDGSLSEIKEAYQRCGFDSRVNSFITPTKLERVIANSHFNLASLEFITLIDEFETPKEAFNSIKAIGANHVTTCNTKVSGLAGRARIMELFKQYPLVNGKAQVSYQVALIKMTKLEGLGIQ